MSQENATRGRTVEQRIGVRWPGLYHLVGTPVMRLPRGSRLRRALLERSVRAGYEAWNRDDMRAARSFADPDVEVYVAQDADLPVGLDDAYYGPDGYCQAMEEWAEAWRNWRVEVEDVVEVAQDKFLVTGRHFGEGRASGVKLERWSAALYTIRRGKILRVDMFFLADKDSVSETVRSIAEGETWASRRRRCRRRTWSWCRGGSRPSIAMPTRSGPPSIRISSGSRSRTITHPPTASVGPCGSETSGLTPGTRCGRIWREVVEEGDSVVASLHVTGRGKSSWVEVDARLYLHFKMRDDRIVHIFEHTERASALEAAGLSDG